jgi:hypothetical protein
MTGLQDLISSYIGINITQILTHRRHSKAFRCDDLSSPVVPEFRLVMEQQKGAEHGYLIRQDSIIQSTSA